MAPADPLTSNLPPQLAPLAAEITAYYRELPQLLADGHEGRIAVVRLGEPTTVWDTTDDALQYGWDRYGSESFLAQPIDSADLDRLAPYFTVPLNKGA